MGLVSNPHSVEPTLTEVSHGRHTGADSEGLEANKETSYSPVFLLLLPSPVADRTYYGRQFLSVTITNSGIRVSEVPFTTSPTGNRTLRNPDMYC